jgi:glycerol-3-phosphate acyltransferase PlsY
MKLGRAAALALGGYLIGSISFSRAIARLASPEGGVRETKFELPGGEELDYHGISATSVAIDAGPKWGIATGVLDTSKAYLPTLVTKRVWPDEPYHGVVATAVMVGHNFPIFHRFKGGRGQTPFYGSVLAMDPIAVPATNIAAVALGAGLLRDVFFAYTLGMSLTIPWFMWRKSRPELAFAVIGNALFVGASYRELLQYLELWRAGKVKRLESWQEFKESYPAMAKTTNIVIEADSSTHGPEPETT